MPGKNAKPQVTLAVSNLHKWNRVMKIKDLKEHPYQRIQEIAIINRYKQIVHFVSGAKLYIYKSQIKDEKGKRQDQATVGWTTNYTTRQAYPNEKREHQKLFDKKD